MSGQKLVKYIQLTQSLTPQKKKKKKLKPLTQKSPGTNLETFMTPIICDRKRDVHFIRIHFFDLIPLPELFYFIFKKTHILSWGVCT